jgi:hypothetical protein
MVRAYAGKLIVNVPEVNGYFIGMSADCIAEHADDVGTKCESVCRIDFRGYSFSLRINQSGHIRRVWSFHIACCVIAPFRGYLSIQ